ncbi:MAG: hypothetical protein ACYCOU_21095 [Sulfobacillus sp.]
MNAYAETMKTLKSLLWSLWLLVLAGCGTMANPAWHAVPIQFAGPTGATGSVTTSPYPLNQTGGTVRIRINGTKTLGTLTQLEWGMPDMPMPHCESGTIRRAQFHTWIIHPIFCMSGTWQLAAVWHNPNGHVIQLRALIPVK